MLTLRRTMCYRPISSLAGDGNKADEELTIYYYYYYYHYHYHYYCHYYLSTTVLYFKIKREFVVVYVSLYIYCFVK